MSMDTRCMGLYFYLRKVLIMSEQTEKLKHTAQEKLENVRQRLEKAKETLELHFPKKQQLADLARNKPTYAFWLKIAKFCK